MGSNRYEPLGVDRQVTLSDGRRLGYAEFGQPRGKAVLYFHGFPGSRLEAALIHETARALAVRVIAVDRPGYGLSDFRAGRALVDWPIDVAELADALGLVRFAVLGVSGGGPYAAVCAWALPRRVARAGMVCGLGPTDVPGVMVGMKAPNRALLRLAGWCPRLVRGLYCFGAPRLLRHPEAFVRHLSRTASGPDREVLRQPALRTTLAASFAEAVCAGPRGPARDLTLYARPWGFPVEDIRVQVHLWHGECDDIVPPAMGRHMARAIPDCQATFFSGHGHFSLVAGCVRPILADLLA